MTQNNDQSRTLFWLKEILTAITITGCVALGVYIGTCAAIQQSAKVVIVEVPNDTE